MTGRNCACIRLIEYTCRESTKYVQIVSKKNIEYNTAQRNTTNLSSDILFGNEQTAAMHTHQICIFQNSVQRHATAIALPELPRLIQSARHSGTVLATLAEGNPAAPQHDAESLDLDQQVHVLQREARGQDRVV